MLFSLKMTSRINPKKNNKLIGVHELQGSKILKIEVQSLMDDPIKMSPFTDVPYLTDDN